MLVACYRWHLQGALWEDAAGGDVHTETDAAAARGTVGPGTARQEGRRETRELTVHTELNNFETLQRESTSNSKVLPCSTSWFKFQKTLKPKCWVLCILSSTVWVVICKYTLYILFNIFGDYVHCLSLFNATLYNFEFVKNDE